jgi:hypothetical protein
VKPASHTFYVAVSVHTDEGGDVVGFDQEWGGSYSDSTANDGDPVDAADDSVLAAMAFVETLGVIEQ